MISAKKLKVKVNIKKDGNEIEQDNALSLF